MMMVSRVLPVWILSIFDCMMIIFRVLPKTDVNNIGLCDDDF